MASEHDAEVLEQGDIFFMYRPRVEEDDPEGEADVQRFYMALKPEGHKPYRLIVIGRKHLPDLPGHERTWGFVDMVSDDPARIEQELREQHYRTRTRGSRTRPAARPAGEGAYAIARTDGQMHLVYALELPRTPGEVQKDLNIAPEASFALSIKNPEKAQSRSAGLNEDQQADFPEQEQKKFRGRRFDREDPELLDYEGAEIVLVGARDDPEQRYGLDLAPEREDPGTADIVRKLRMVKSRHPLKPLVKGDWA